MPHHSKFNTVTEDNREHIGPHSLLPPDHPVSKRLEEAGMGIEMQLAKVLLREILAHRAILRLIEAGLWPEHTPPTIVEDALVNLEVEEKFRRVDCGHK